MLLTQKLYGDFELSDHSMLAWRERITEELSYIEKLLTLHPDLATTWTPKLAQAVTTIRNAASLPIDSFRDTVLQIETQFAPLAQTAKSYSIYAAGHAHLDMNWMWSWQETVVTTHDTFLTVLQLMDEYPEFYFSQSQCSCYQIIEDHYPELLDLIRQRVKEGRWESLASHWVENDGNMAGSAALCRHLAESRRYMADLFDLSAADIPIDWAPDTFGHAARIPTYLNKGGIKYYYLHRIGIYTKPIYRAFWWEAPDKSRVLVFNARDVGYNVRISSNLWQPLLDFARDTGISNWFVAYGIGDHGGGPTRRDLERVRDFNTWPLFPRFVLSTVKNYFELLERQAEQLPVVRGELNTELTGCLTTQSQIKMSNRIAENRLCDAGLARALAGSAMQKHAPEKLPSWPSQRMSMAWRSALFTHFHDVLPGSCVRDARTYAQGKFQDILATATIAELHPLRAFAAAVTPAVPLMMTRCGEFEKTPSLFMNDALGAGVGFGMGGVGMPIALPPTGGTLPGSAGVPDCDGIRRFVVYNPTNHQRQEIVEITVWDNGEPYAPVALKDCSFQVHYANTNNTNKNDQIFTQTIKHGHYWGHEYVTVVFPLTVPALGWTAVALEAQASGAGQNMGKRTRVDRVIDVSQTGVWQTGQVPTIFYVPPEAPGEGLENDLIRVDIDTQTGAIKKLTDKRTGQTLIQSTDASALEFVQELPHPMTSWSYGRTGLPQPVILTDLRRAKTGPYIASIETDLSFGQSKFTMTYSLFANDPKLHVSLSGIWLETGSPTLGVPNLRWKMSTELRNAQATYEIPFGTITRDFVRGEEVPGLEWVAVSGKTLGNESAGLIVATDSKYGYSLNDGDFRITLIRAAYDPDPLPEAGQQQIAWSIMPFAGQLKVTDGYSLARSLNHALRPIPASISPGDAKIFAPTGQFLRWSGAELCDIAPCINDTGIEIRAFEIEGQDNTLTLDFNQSPLGIIDVVLLIDLNGQVIKTLESKQNIVQVPLAAHGIVAVRIKFQ